MIARALIVMSAIVLGIPALATSQEDAGPVTIQGAFGTNVNVGGNTETLSVGFLVSDRIGILVSGERIHLPTDVEQHENGSSATRGGTTTFVSGEVQFVPFTFTSVSPYALAGAGGGRSRPNVNDLFPDRVTSNAALLFFGGGLRVPSTVHLSVFADLRFVLQLEGRGAGVFLFVPVRGGVAWRF